MNSAIIRVWITRNSAISLQIGGLKNCTAWFVKPEWFHVKLEENDRDSAFGDISIKEGLYKHYGWFEPRRVMPTMSVGRWIGYDNAISDFIWKKLEEHFHNEPFDNWHITEKEGRSKVEDFLLEISVNISLIK